MSALACSRESTLNYPRKIKYIAKKLVSILNCSRVIPAGEPASGRSSLHVGLEANSRAPQSE